MRKDLRGISWLLLSIALVGCARVKPTLPPSVSVDKTALAVYSGPKARIAVADFEVKAAKANGEIGSGLREMLVTALLSSNHFFVLERQAPTAVKEGQELSSSGAELKTAELIIAASVSEFEPQAAGGRAGMGGGGSVHSGILGGLLGTTLNKAHLALDIRIIDVATAQVLAVTQVQGQAQDTSGSIMSGVSGNGGLGRGLSVYARTPLEKAIRICIVEAVRYISEHIPQGYYKYTEGHPNGKT